MKKMIVRIMALVLTVIGAAQLVSPAVMAESICDDMELPASVRQAAGCDVSSSDNIGDSLIKILTAVIGLLGVVAVIVIVIGGVQYMTSTGDASKIKRAKDTILYAVIGLIVCVLAGVIVNTAIAAIVRGL